MADLNHLRQEPDLYRRACRDKNIDPNLIDQILDLDARKRKIETELNELRHQHRLASKQYGQNLMKQRAGLV